MPGRRSARSDERSQAKRAVGAKADRRPRGEVIWYGYLGPDRQPLPGFGAYRIKQPAYDEGNLAVSRAFGDRLERPFVSSVPDVRKFDFNPETDHFIILASDGVWDVMTSKEAVNFVRYTLWVGLFPR